jgi:ApaG protein
MSRRWIITDARGGTEEVKGPGVVGKQPKLGPTQSFEYTSGCPLNTSFGSMQGWYQMVTQDGTEFEVPIPGFALRDPRNMQ